MFDINKATEEQKQVLLEKDKNILVSAAAGSGKTTVMIERIVRTIINDKVPIENFLIITFTKASAEDMKNKLINRLSCEPVTPFILSQIDNVPVSDVSNLHSFCARLLKSYFYVVGLDPTFSVIDDIEQNKLKTRALDKLFDMESKSASDEFYALVDIFSNNRKDGKLREQILKLYEFSKSIYGFEEWFEKNINDSFTHDLEKNKCAKIIKNYAKNIIYLFKEEINLLKCDINSNCCNDDKKKLIEYLDSIDTMLNMINIAGDFEHFSESIKNLGKFKTIPKVDETSIYYQNKCKELKTDVKARIDTVYESIFASDEDTLETIYHTLDETKKHVLGLYDLYVKFENIYNELKKDLGVLDFNDLESYALKVLEDTDTLQAIKDKYKYIFVDEYQDINSCQEKIISLISSDNNRFMVGDIKQSIYGFRLCDPEIFLNKYNLYKSGDKNSVGISLNKNFRSHAEILEFVNIIFDDTMTKSFGGVDYKTEARLIPGKEIKQKETNPRATILYMNTTKSKNEHVEILDKLPVYSVKNHQYKVSEDTKKAYLEGLMIAKKISELVSSSYYIEDKETHKLRHIEYKDIVLLVQSRNEYLNDLLDVLDSFLIPISSDISSDIFEDEDVLALKNLLLIISNFNQDKPLFSLMYSHLFGFTPDELMTIRENSNEKYFYDAVRNYQNDNSELYYKIIDFIEKIKFYQKLAGFLMVKDLCYRIFNDFNIENYCLASYNSAEKISKLNKFISSMPNTTLEEYLLNSDLTNIFSESKTATDSVKVMTIHKSKGLEFPVVFLIGTGNKFNMKSVSGDMVISKELGVCMNYFNMENRYKTSTITRQATKIIENKKFFEEQQRLLYVALTRAIDYLFISGAIDEKSLHEKFTSTPTKFIDWFASIILNKNDKRDFFLVEEYSANDFDKFVKDKNEKNILIGKDDEALTKSIEKNLNFIYPYDKLTSTPQKTSVTTIVKNTTDIEYTKNKTYNNISSEEIGTTYHYIFEKLSLLENTLDEIENVIQKLITSRMIDAKNIDNISPVKILKCLKIPEFRSLITASDWIKKESEFYMLLGESDNPIDKSTVQGIVDLIVSVNGELVIVDYKTGYLDEISVKNKYSKQLELYSLAVEKIYSKKVKNKYILAIDMEKLFKI